MLAKLSETLGKYPHAALSVGMMKKQTTHMRLYQCLACEQKIRAASDELDAQCNDCDSPFVLIIKKEK